MQLSDYQKKAMEFRLPSANAYYAQAGLMGEVGELMSHFAKCTRDGHPLDSTTLAKELGDILWFIAAIASDFNIELDYIAQKNIDKLSDRKVRNKIMGSGDNR